MSQYTDRSYAEELRVIRERLLRMAGRVENMIEQSMKALMERDAELAKATIICDHDVNQDEVDLDAMCLELLATRQPMASDLRFVILTMKMVTDLERIADLAVNISERVIDLSRKPSIGPFENIAHMEILVRRMIHNSIDAFVERDVEKARAVIETDDEVDELYSTVFRAILDTMRSDSFVVHRGIKLQSVAKYLERIGDHATNLAEQIIQMIEGTDVRHEGKLVDDTP
jgi:phosphate transport system protein